MTLELAMRFSFSAFRRPLITLSFAALLTACGGLTVEDDYPQTDTTASEESGSIFDLFRRDGGAEVSTAAQTSAPAAPRGLGVNALLWQASLDTLSFMPLASADPLGGVIITEWYNDPAATNERVKINLVISGRDLRADALRVSVFRETNRRGQWVATAASARAARQMENIILTRARDLAVARRAAQ